ncbi:hypothetical protein [Actinomyces sp.]|uniref:hypothetical protein n=1 Tax=Actinomyces sp. TaxID=29317 RepID=UPI0026DB80C3|nr:hypothetical protein [Actinomyces sp.]MDO4655787.1 hypothetical protein [Actinomyces sp.]
MTTIEIVSDANGSHRLVGQAHVTRSRGQVFITFLYDPTYLAGCEQRSRKQIDYPQGR